MMTLKVCQLCAVDFTVAKFLRPLIDGMVVKGWNVTTVCSDGPYVADLRASGYQIHTETIARTTNPLRALASIWALVKFFRHEKFDVVHVHTPVAALVGRIAAKLCGVPFVIYTAHGFYFHDDMPSWKRRVHIGLERFAGLITDLLFTQSSEDAASAVELGIMSAENVHAIGNGVDVARFDPTTFDSGSIRDEIGVPQEATLVGIVGRLVREKGYLEFLSAAREIARAETDIYFLLIGGRLESDHSDAVDPEVRRLKAELGDRLIVAGMREDIPELLSSMDIFCLPSHREGMPRTIIEAMVMGKPVVATDIRGAREEVVHQKTGLLVPVRASGALAEAIQLLIRNPDMALSMGRAGRSRALDLYDEVGVVNLQIGLLEKNFTESHVLP